MSTLLVEVIRKRQEALHIASFELARADGAPLPAFDAGAHIDVRLPGGLVRQYSLCNAGETQRYRIAVLRDAQSRGGSRAMHEAVDVGDRLEISTPRNHFKLLPARRSLLLAGGIGITPLLCMAQSLDAAGADFALHYCARSPGHAAFRDDIEAARYARQVQWHFDDGATGQKLDAAQLLSRPDPATHIYVCGPKGFIDHITATARAQGWPDSQVHFEHFGAAPVAAPGADQAFEVRLARSGRSFEVPAHLSVVQALQACGVDIPVSCEQGVCGTCLTPVLEGLCDHRDLFLTDAEKARNDQFTPCCSRAQGPLLVLDL